MTPPLPPPCDAAGFVLAGGQSTRMGTDKALVDFAGRPLIAHALHILREAGLDAKIAGALSDLSHFAPVVADAKPGLGPLGGICAALGSTEAQWSVFLSVDMPLLPSSLVVYMLSHAQLTGAPLTVAAVNGFPQTFPAVIHRDCLPALENELKNGRRGCFSAYQTAVSIRGQALAVLPVELLAQTGHMVLSDGLPPMLFFSNFNSRRDMVGAAARRAASRRVS